ncbi:energy-coupling factor transporter transmembrane protein EcfT [bacterium]|nr:energy-coupling factor transporter transmembrane protein EcfT [bacterium]
MPHVSLLTDPDFHGPLHELDARSKILIFFGILLSAVLVPNGHWLLFAIHLILIVLFLILSRMPVSHFLTHLGVILPILAMVLFASPFLASNSRAPVVLDLGWIGTITEAGLIHLISLACKALLAISSVILLIHTAKFHELLRGFEQIRVPVLLIQVTAMASRYLLLLVEDVTTLRNSMVNRGYRGRWIGQARLIGRLVGVLFLRSIERSERISHAMLSRGWRGGARRVPWTPLAWVDFGTSGVVVILLVVIQVGLR